MNDLKVRLEKSRSITPESLTFDNLNHLRDLYPEVLVASPQQKRHKVEPSELLRLDTFRYDELPMLVAKRRVESGKGYVTKRELQDLMSWKLARGVFRPTLPKLIASNDESAVEKITKKALALYEPTSTAAQDSVFNCVDALGELKGVGIATASLIFSVANPTTGIFFSDELYYFIGQIKGPSLEKIKYNKGEYRYLLTTIEAMRASLSKEGASAPNASNKSEEKPEKGEATSRLPGETRSVRCDDIERAAFVIQKLHNPDIWTAVFNPAGNSGPISQNTPTTSANRDSQPEIVVIEEAKPHTDQNPALTEKEKEMDREAKKQVVKAHGGKVKQTGKKRGRPEAEEDAPRRSLRTAKRQAN